MINKKMFSTKTVSAFVLGVLLALSVLVNATLAYFTDSASSGADSVIQFGSINVETAILDNKNSNQVISTGSSDGTINFNVDATYVASMDDVDYTLRLTDDTTEPFYLRLTLSSSNSNKFALSIASSANSQDGTYKYVSSNWMQDSSGKYYYNGIVDLAKYGSQYIPLKLSFDNEFSDADFASNSTLQLTINVEVIQSANSGYTGWSDRPTNWPVWNTASKLPTGYTRLESITFSGGGTLTRNI